MSEFIIRFFLCNILLTGFIGILLGIKHFFRPYISARVQFDLWFFMLGLMPIPFLPFHLPKLHDVFQLAECLSVAGKSGIQAVSKLNSAASSVSTTGWADDFAVSVTRDTPSTLIFLFCFIWIIGVLAMLFLVVRSGWHLQRLKSSALPLQNKQVYALFLDCASTLHITGRISIFSTAFLKSPITVGLLHPQIYIPIHLISDYCEKDMRYILLHELQHYRHRDAIPNTLMNLAGIFYWFNPAVWYALKEMRTDREVACDCAVLQCLTEKDYGSYGSTLINFAEKISLSPFPFASGLSGNMKQIQKRVLSIASYHPVSRRQKMHGLTLCMVTALLFLTCAPLLSTHAATQEYDNFQASEEHVSYMDLSADFNGYNGSFVLYDTADDSWQIYNKKLASTRVAPDSTYKIYVGLMGLETGTISLDNSLLRWDGTNQPFDSWNADQDLSSAMSNSVNWYFERIESSIGRSEMKSYLNQIHYGNQDMSAGDSYWMESSLKISPIEQVELLKCLNTNQFSMDQSHIDAVKNAICISSDSKNSLYGKTGTGRINGYDVNGWFIGYVEDQNHTVYFALNIQGAANATGSKAAEITRSILSERNIWKQ